MDIKSLNKEQRKAVEKIGGPVLVFAGAGSGKTRVLTSKIAYLIESIGLPPNKILAVTFTNKAAQEMKSRVFDLVKSDITGISIGTFHSIGAMILRKEIHLINYENNFTIYDAQDSKGLIKNTIKELEFDLKMYDPRSVQIRISNAKNTMQMPEDILGILDDTNINQKKFVEIYKMYQKKLKENNALDFDDLLLLPLKIFNEFPDRLLFYQNKFQYVLVDEYQDTNKPQFELIFLLTKDRQDIFVVGDDDQSIYGWRGADISNILDFNKSFKNASIIKLEQNYRSTKNILDAAWSVVSRNINRSEKKLWTDNEIGKKIIILEGYNEKDESIKIFNNILEIKKKMKASYNDFVILYRTNAQSRPIENTFMINGMQNNYHIIGGVKFYDRKEIKDILAYLRLFVNKKDSISFERIVNFPPRGIGKTSLEKIYSSNTDPLIAIKKLEDFKLGNKQKQSLSDFNNLIHLYSDKAEKDSPSDIVKDLIEELKLKNYYENHQTSDSVDRWKNIEEFVSGISEYESMNKSTTLSDYLEEVSLLTDIDSWKNNDDKVTLMTIHSAKGLEFKYVFVTGLEDGLFPVNRSFEDADIEEERRLFYVALTRAHERVFLSYAKSRRKFGSEPIPTVISRFVKEIPDKLIDTSINIKNTFSQKRLYLDSKIDVKVNDKVEHKIFGKGRILKIEGIGKNSKITILFFNNERKKLIYKYANLEILTD